MDKEPTRHFVQTTKALKARYGAWAATMRAMPPMLRRGTVSSEAIGNALYLWAVKQDPKELAEMLAPYLDEFLEEWARRDRAGNPGESTGSVVRPVDMATGQPKGKDRKRRGTG